MAKVSKSNKPTGRLLHISAALAGAGNLTPDRRSPATHFIGDPHPKRWQGDHIEIALRKLFPGNIPLKEELPNQELVRRVLNFMVEQDLIDARHPHPSSDSILRAAGRKARGKRKPRT